MNYTEMNKYMNGEALVTLLLSLQNYSSVQILDWLTKYNRIIDNTELKCIKY